MRYPHLERVEGIAGIDWMRFWRRRNRVPHFRETAATVAGLPSVAS